MRHLLFSFWLTSLIFTVNWTAHSQTMYFQLKKEAEKPTISNGTTSFQQPDIQALTVGKPVNPALKHPEKYHSEYAEVLSRTYQLNLEGLSENEKILLGQNLSNCSDVELVEVAPEQILLSPCPTNDPDDAGWNLSRHEITCVQEAFCITHGDPSISIAVRDNGFMTDHPEHLGKVVFAELGAYNGQCHGNQTSITAAGATDNGFGISSSGYDCSLMLYLWGSDFVDDYVDIADRGARIVNNSYLNSCAPIQAHQNVINLVTDLGVIVVGSAGNGNGAANCGGIDDNDPTFPSAYDNVISVSSVSSILCTETTFNFWGLPFDPPLHHTHNGTVDLLAQGYAVVTGDCGGGGQAMAYGTSIAGPHVAGIIGLMLSVNPCLNHDDILSILISTGQDVSGVCNNQDWYPNGVPPVPCAESAVLMAQSYIGPDLVISQNTDWDQKFVSGNVIIDAGATLTIHGVVSMGQNSKIIVEKGANLIVDGGVLTSCHDEWKGIVVEGDAVSGNQVNAGRVRLMNGAIIENAVDGISMHPTHIPWPATADHWGGLVEADNSTFRNCRRAVAFMKFGTGFIEDQSYFNTCTFQDIATSAVTIWSDNNVTFQQCTFENAGRGIYAYDSEVIVNDGCLFTNLHTGVDIFTTYPILYAPQIGQGGTQPNDFQCTNYGVYAMAQGNIKPFIVNNNNFQGGYYGVHINGESNYQITSNDFIGEYAGVESAATGGTHSNYIAHNNISSSSYGGHAAYDNSNLEYLDNCFGFNNFSDVYVNSGNIFISQGSEEIASGNCFTKGGVPEIDNSQNNVIQLWVWANESEASCEFPTVVYNDPSYSVNVIKESLELPDDDCGAQFSPGVINVRTFCKGPFKTKQQILDKIEEIEALITAVENNPNLSQEYKDYLIQIYKRCLDKLAVEVAIKILEPSPDDPDGLAESQRIDTAIYYLGQSDEFNIKILAYGLMVNSGQLIEANTFLNNLVTTSSEQNGFKIAQNINLDYLFNTEGFSLSAEDGSALYNIGIGTAPLDGYARSIYEVLTGNRIELDIPNPHNSIRPRSNNNKKTVEQPAFAIYPNPSGEGYVNIDIIGIEANSIAYKIYDIYGRLIANNLINGRFNKVKTDNWREGMYIISIVDEEGALLHTTKLLITH